MSCRQHSKVPSHFLVHFDDNSWLVVSKSKIQCDGMPVVGQSYSVQYGNSRYEADNGKIVRAGEWVDMRKEMNIRKTKTVPTLDQQLETEVVQQPEAEVVQQPEAEVVQQPAKKQKKTTKADKSKECRVIKRTVQPTVSIDHELPVITTPISNSRIQTTQSISCPLTPVAPVSSSVNSQSTPTTSSIANSMTPDAIVNQSTSSAISVTPSNHFTLLYRKLDQIGDKVLNNMNELSAAIIPKLENLTRRVSHLENGQRELRSLIDRQTTTLNAARLDIPDAALTTENQPESNGDTLNENVPPEYKVDVTSLRQLNNDSKGPGNFAKRLVEKLFPELFGPENMRNTFSYNGGGPKNKRALDPVRKMVIQRYVLYFYPELSRETSYQHVVVNTINEGLRRPDQQSRKKQKTAGESVVTADHSASAMFADISLTQEILADPYHILDV